MENIKEKAGRVVLCGVAITLAAWPSPENVEDIVDSFRDRLNGVDEEKVVLIDKMPAHMAYAKYFVEE